MTQPPLNHNGEQPGAANDDAMLIDRLFGEASAPQRGAINADADVDACAGADTAAEARQAVERLRIGLGALRDAGAPELPGDFADRLRQKWQSQRDEAERDKTGRDETGRDESGPGEPAHDAPPGSLSVAAVLKRHSSFPVFASCAAM